MSPSNKLFNFCCIPKPKNKSKKQIIPMNYTLPGTTLSLEEMGHVRDKNLRKLIDEKKLHLILDLDNTLVHTTTLDTLTSTDKEFIRKKLKKLKDDSYILKKRPGVSTFLQELSSIFDITVYTLAGRSYAKMVTDILDPNESIFKHVITYEDCTLAGQKGLDVVMSHERMVLIVDDLQEVWSSRHTQNLIQIVPYNFFESQDYNVEDLVNDELGCDMDKELFRVLETLKTVHNVFYYGESNFMELEKKDVRDVLKGVLSMGCKTVLHQNKHGDIISVGSNRSKRGWKFYWERALRLALYASF